MGSEMCIRDSCQLYDMPLTPSTTRQLLQQLSGQNALLGGVQLGLGLLKQLLLVLVPVPLFWYFV